MIAEPTLLALLGLAAVAGAWRAARHAPRHRLIRAITQFVLAAALAAVLAWPTAEPARTLVVLTEGTTVGAHPVGDANSRRVVALPGTIAPPGVERVPDLATALRRHPGTTALHVHGHGLPARDRVVAQGTPLRFTAVPSPPGLAYWNAPQRTRVGRAFTVSGRVRGWPGGSVELLGPGDVSLARAPLRDDGRFELTTWPKVEGLVDASLRVLDRDAAERERIPLPLRVDAGAALRIAVVAGAPSAELKYLRRWARDAGHALRTRIALSPGIALRDGAFTFDADTLAALDLVIVDERGYLALAAHERAALDDAVREGLGLLLRVTGPVPPAVVDAWSAFGWRVEGSGNALPVQLRGVPPSATGPRRFERADVDFASADAVPLLLGEDRVVLARWRAHGLGRVAAWALLDAWRLVLAGEASRHGALWADAVETLARARGAAPPRFAANARTGERTTICGIGGDARVEAPGGTTLALLPVAIADETCAAYWPAAPGWHVLVDGARREPFAVRDAASGAAASARERRVATRALARTAPAHALATDAGDWRTPAAWLLVAVLALAWWSERRA